MNAQILSKDGVKVVKLNRRRAIHARCLDCVGWQSHEVKECDIGDCPLHPFRSGTGKQNAKNRSRAIRDYCRWCTDGKVSACSSPLCPLYPFKKSGVESAEKTLFFREKHDIESDFNPSEGKAVQNPSPTDLRRKSVPMSVKSSHIGRIAKGSR
jgi:hypothetical protein